MEFFFYNTSWHEAKYSWSHVYPDSKNVILRGWENRVFYKLKWVGITYLFVLFYNELSEINSDILLHHREALGKVKEYLQKDKERDWEYFY